MKAVLMAFSPKECEKIFNGEKTVDERKVAPKLETPFKVYVYCTKARHKPNDWMYLLPNDKTLYFGANARDVSFVREEGDFRNGMVIGEFVCDKIIGFSTDWINGVSRAPLYIKGTCITGEQLFDCSKGKPLYGLYITKPKRYDTPKELSEFSRYGYKKIEHKGSGYVFRDNTQCRYCEPDEVIAGLYIPPVCRKGGCKITRPPQSFCYVEEIEE